MVVLEEGRNDRLTQGLADLLGRLATVAVAGQKFCVVPEQPPAVLLYHAGDGCVVRAPRTVAVLGPDLDHCPTLELPAGTRVLLSTQNPHAADFAGRSGLPLLDCGLSLRDTLTLSSHTRLESVITLQRSVEDLWGRGVDPVDLPLTLDRELPSHLLLYFAGICLLAGWTDRLTDFKF